MNARRHQQLDAEIIRFPIARSRPAAHRPRVDVSHPRGDVGLWLDEQTAIDVERQLEERQQLIARARDVGAIASAIAAVTFVRPQDCANAAREISALLVAGLSASS
jgi:hypothetical protein